MPNPIDNPGYRYATVKYPGDGVRTEWEFNFAGPAPGYLSREHVFAYLTDATRVETKITIDSFIGPNSVVVTPPVPVGKILIIRRYTPKEGPLVDFTDGSILNETNLNKTTEQAVYCAAEMVDYFADLYDYFRAMNSDATEALRIALLALARANEALALVQAAYDRASEALLSSAEALAAALEAQAMAEAALDLAQQAVDQIIIATNAAIAAQAAADAAAISAGNAASSAVSAQSAAEAAAAQAAAANAAVQDILNRSKNMEIAIFLDGRFDAANSVFKYVAGRDFTIPTTGHPLASLKYSPTNDLQLVLWVESNDIGTLDFPAGTRWGTFNIPAPFNVTKGQRMGLDLNEPDETAESMAITIVGRRA